MVVINYRYSEIIYVMHGDIGYNLGRISSSMSSIIINCIPLAREQSCSRNIHYFGLEETGWEKLNIEGNG